MLSSLLSEEYYYCRIAELILDMLFLTIPFSPFIITVVRQSGNEEILPQLYEVSGK